MKGRWHVVVAAVCFVTGAAVVVVFESALSRVVGILALVAFVVVGAAAILSPSALAADDDEARDEHTAGR